MVMLLRFSGKRRSWKLELFRAKDWPVSFFAGGGLYHRYRLRVNGKWFNLPDGRPVCYTIHEVRDLMWRSMGPPLRKRR